MISRNLRLAAANLLLPISLLIFATGFFPHKPFLPGLASYRQLEATQPPDAPFNKLIFMVVDALRSDFVFANKSGFHFTQSLIRDGLAMPFTSHARSPTVTMPRVKALTTGSIPSFLDMILNVVESDTTSSLAQQDTWIAQMKAKNTGKLAMYGDDTWLKLFPNTFDRYDGTTSFFVSDFSDVDNNVTRHVPAQMSKNDWSVTVMHYLGMDHIGHKSGAFSINMYPKQREMDEVVRQMFTATQTHQFLESALLVLCGDHGMTDAGNHGGSAPGETSAAMVIMSPKFGHISTGLVSPTEPYQDLAYYDVVEQSDIAPTLAGLLGFPIPLNNLGVFISQLLPMWSNEDDQIQLLYRNALQLLSIVKETFPHDSYSSNTPPAYCENPSSTTDELACLWQDAMKHLHNRPWVAELAQEPLLRFCYKAQASLSSIANNYNATRLFMGIGVALASVMLCVPIESENTPSITSSSATVYIGLASVLYDAMMFASSFVEEEQQFWYWMCAAWALISSLRSTIPSLELVLITALRVLRRWNQSGQKHVGSPDIATFLRSHPVTLAVLAVMTYCLIALNMATTFKLPVSGVLATILIISTTLFKLVFTLHDAPEIFGTQARVLFDLTGSLPGPVNLSRAVFALCSLALITLLVYRPSLTVRSDNHKAFVALATVLLVNQLRATNIPTILLLHFIWTTLDSRTDIKCNEFSVWTLLLSHVSFFALGGTNGISSIDLSNSYNGIGAYNAVAVGFLLFVSNWVGPIYFSIQGLVVQLNRTENSLKWSTWSHHVRRLSFFMAMAVLGIETACTVLREHLFVWTVFSPKFLYAGAWVGGWHLGVNILLGAAITAALG